MRALSSLALLLPAALACSPPPATSQPTPQAAAPVEEMTPTSPPIVDMRGCMVLASAREKASEEERARADCPSVLLDETRRESGKNVVYGFTFHRARTDDVRARAVKEACCYDKVRRDAP